MAQYDLSTSSKWASLSNGSHTVKIKAKATGYEDSDFSTTVTFTVAHTYTVTTSLANCSKKSGPTTVTYGQTATFVFAATNGYDLPSSVTVDGATIDNYTQSTGTLVIKDVTGQVSITVMAVAKTFTVTMNLANMTKTSGPESVRYNGTAQFVLAADTGYTLPDTVTISGATLGSWDNSTGALSIRAVTNNVTITAAGVSAGVTLEAGTYEWIDTPSFTEGLEASFNFTTTDEQGITNNWVGLIVRSTTQMSYLDVLGGKGSLAYDDGWSSGRKTITLSTDQQVSQEFYTWAIAGGNLVEQASTKTFTLPTTLEMGGGTTPLLADGYTITQGDIQVSESVYNVLTALNAGGSLADFGNTCGLTIPSNMVLLFKMGVRLIPGADAEVTDDGKYRATIAGIGVLTTKQTGVYAIEFNFVDNTATYTAVDAENIDAENHAITLDGTFGENNLVVFCYEGSTTETWLLNEQIDVNATAEVNLEANFTSNNQQFTQISMSIGSIDYKNTETDVSENVFNIASWTDEAYRTVIFDEAPTGALLSWLQANGTKQ